MSLSKVRFISNCQAVFLLKVITEILITENQNHCSNLLLRYVFDVEN